MASLWRAAVEKNDRSWIMLLCFLMTTAVGLLSLVEYRLDHLPQAVQGVVATGQEVAGAVQGVVKGGAAAAGAAATAAGAAITGATSAGVAGATAAANAAAAAAAGAAGVVTGGAAQPGAEGGDASVPLMTLTLYWQLLLMYLQHPPT